MQNIRTDLAVEAHELSRREAKNATEIDGVISDVRTEDEITVTNIEITNENGSKALGKAIGNYITIESPNLKYSIDIYERVCTLISEEIRKMADIKSDSLTLVVGLGNRDITPDALGTEVVSRLLVTHHIKQNMKDYKQQESSLLDVIYRKFLGEALTEEEKKQIKAIDDDLLWYDLEMLLGEKQDREKPELHIRLDYKVRPFDMVEREYLDFFRELSSELESKV